jgi:hypothetical protein
MIAEEGALAQVGTGDARSRPWSGPCKQLSPDRVETVSWNYTTGPNVAPLLLAGWLLVRFVRAGGWPMLRITGGPADRACASASGHSAGHR